ncbi:MAG: hypothetical protein HY691_15385 [Chloroflexi bacterium]|nr:hypothetical protein [Chloroflexota bacterium]
MSQARHVAQPTVIHPALVSVVEEEGGAMDLTGRRIASGPVLRRAGVVVAA